MAASATAAVLGRGPSRPRSYRPAMSDHSALRSADPFAPVLGARRGRPDGAGDAPDGAAGPSLLDRLDKLCLHLCDLAEARPNRLTEPELLQHSAGVLARGVGLKVWEVCLFAGPALLPVGEADGNTVLALIELDRGPGGAGRAHAYVCRDLVLATRQT